MSKPFTIATWVTNHVLAKSAHWGTDGSQPVAVPGWAVVGLFVEAEDGQPTCVDYRVRAIPDTRNPVEVWETLQRLSKSLEDGHSDLPVPVVTPGGVPRYVFEEASQTVLLNIARKTTAESAFYADRLSPDVKAALEGGGRRKAGRPPKRGVREKLEILEAVENAYLSGRGIGEVASQWHMSQSSVRDLLSWARHDASPRLFTNPGQGRRGGQLTSEARAQLALLRKAAD